MGVGTGVLAWLLYLACLAPTVTYGGDCGELIAASYALGIGHPTGYPFFCLLGRLWASIIPFGEVGWRYNLLSGTLGALSVGLIAATAHRMLWEREQPKRALWAAGGAALLLAGFYYYGSQNVIGEVYSLNAFFLALLLWHAVSWLESRDWRHFYALALSFGLSLTAHLSGLFLGPALLGIAIIAPRLRFAPFFPFGAKRLALALALCAAGFGLTIYLPLRSRMWPAAQPTDLSLYWPLDWGHPVDFVSWKEHITGKAYDSLLMVPHKVHILGRTVSIPEFQQPLSLWPRKVSKLLQLMALQLLAAAPFVLVGLLAPFVEARRARSQAPDAASGATPSTRGEPEAAAEHLRWVRLWVTCSLLVAWALNVGIQINYDVNDITNFFFPAYIAQAVWLALGFDAAGRWLAARTLSWAPRVRWRVHTLARLSLLGAVIVQWIFFFLSGSYHGQTRARDRALESASALEALQRRSGVQPVAFIFSNDALWVFWYAQYVLGRAKGTLTPWGAQASADMRGAPQDKLVAQAKRRTHAPIAVAQWDDALDQRFPLELLSGSNSLCLATDRALPTPATAVLSKALAQSTPDHSIFSARFRRTPLTSQLWENTQSQFDEPLATLDAPALQDARQAGVPALKRSDMAALDLEFARPAWPALRTVPSEGAAYIGWVQVLTAKMGKFGSAPPSRPIEQFESLENLPFVHTTSPQITAWTQNRRLVVPIGSKPGTRLRASYALVTESDAIDGLFQVWARLVRDKNDTRTPWQRVDLIQVTHI